jgi:hypothetical protein
LKKWSFISRSIKKKITEENKSIQSNFNNKLEIDIKMMSENITELNNKKLDKYEFDNARKLMDLEYMKHYCDEVRDVMDV